MDQPPVSARWLILQQRVDGDVDTYMDSVQANVLGQVGSSDPSRSTWSSKLVDTYPTMPKFVHHHLASWASWSEKVIRLVMFMAVHSRKFIHTNIHHQVPGRWFVKLVKAKDTFQRMLKNQNRDKRHGSMVGHTIHQPMLQGSGEVMDAGRKLNSTRL